MTIQERWKQMVADWLERIRPRIENHARLAIRYNRLHYGVGIPAALLAAAIGTGLVAGLIESDSIAYRSIAAGISFLAAILAAVQSLARFAAESEKHSRIASRLDSFLQELEYRKAFPPSTRREADSCFSQLRRAFSDIPSSPVSRSITQGLRQAVGRAVRLLSTRASTMTTAEAVGRKIEAEEKQADAYASRRVETRLDTSTDGRIDKDHLDELAKAVAEILDADSCAIYFKCNETLVHDSRSCGSVIDELQGDWETAVKQIVEFDQ